MAIDREELQGKHFERRSDGMRKPNPPDTVPVGLSEEARDMRNAGRQLEKQEVDDSDLIAAARRLHEAVHEQEANNRQLVKDTNSLLQEMRVIVEEVARIRSDAQDETRSARQAALSGVNRAQQEAERLTIRNLDKVTKKSEEYIDSMVQLAKRRIERLALITLPDKLFNILKWIVVVLALFILSHVAWGMIA